MSLISQEIIDLDKQLFAEYLTKHVPSNKGLRITYGTAGFRSHASYLQHVKKIKKKEVFSNDKKLIKMIILEKKILFHLTKFKN